MDAELARQRDHADALRAGCSHSVHFLVREPCSGSFLWFYRRADQRVVRFPGEVAVVAGNDSLIWPHRDGLIWPRVRHAGAVVTV